MIWLFIVVFFLLFSVAIYYSFPILRKMFKKWKNSEKRAERQAKKQEKKQEKLERRKIKSVKKEKVEAKNPNALTGEGTADLENEHAIDLDADPDAQVNYDNFDLEGLFDEQDKNTSLETQPHYDNPFDDNIESLFNEYFENTRAFDEFNALNKPQEELERFDEEEFMEMLNRRDEGSEIKRDLQNLSPEMKALLISNFLDRKSDD